MTFEDFTANYPPVPHEKATPAAMRRIAALFDIECREVDGSRVLEIGCGSGMNILSLALLYPNAELVGLDFSQAVVDRGTELAKELGARNVTFELSTLEDETYGPSELYDYVIVPELYSRIDEPSREVLFQLVKRVLMRNGLAVVSYNTYPGWNVVRTVREMMLYHVGNFKDPEKRALEARKLLNFIVANNEKIPVEPYRELIEEEAAIINTMEAALFAKQYLSPVHEAFYFSDFMSAAETHGLHYVGDVELEYMFLGNYAELAQTQLGEITDCVPQEQYLDFITNRRSRHTILAKREVATRDVKVERLRKFNFRLGMVPKVPIQDSNYEENSLEIVKPENRSVGATVTGKFTIACIDFMSRNFPRSMSVKEIASGARSMVETPEKEVSEALDVLLVRAVSSGIFVMETEMDRFDRRGTSRPKVFGLARYQCSRGLVVSNVLHQSVQLTPLDQKLMPSLDGEKNFESLIEDVETLLRDGALSLSEEDLDVGAEPRDQDQIAKLVEERLKFYAVNALLVP